MRAVPKRREVRFFAFCWLALCAACTTIPGDQADLVLRGGSIYTMDAVRSWAEAVAVRHGEIVYVGPESGLEKYTGPRTRVVDLRGRMVLPAFQDAHIHPVAAGVDLRSLALYDLKTVEEYLRAVAKHAAAHPGAGWIRGGGWSIPAFSGAAPTRHQLDAVVSDRPVFLLSSDGHTAWANSKALELAGIDRDTPDPPGGRIDRDPQTGEPAGWLREESAMRMVLEHAPAYPAEELEADTASLLEPYVDQPGLSGASMIAPGKLSRIVTRLDRI